jgi:hypothetical protein
VRNFFQDPEAFVKRHSTVTHQVSQNPRYVFPDSSPAFHLSSDCSCLHSDYENIEIPAQIRVRGTKDCEEFRAWAIENKREYDTNRERFLLRLCGRFKIKRSELILVDRITTGVEKVDLKGIDYQINCLLGKAGAFYHASDKNRAILWKYGRHTSLAYTNKTLYANNTGFGDDEVKMFLINYDVQFKKPLKKMLITYYRLQFNNELQFSSSLVKLFNLELCRRCQKKAAGDRWRSIAA